MKQSKKYRRAIRKRNTRKKQKIIRTRKRYQKRKRVTRKKTGGGWFGNDDSNDNSSLSTTNSGVIVHGTPYDPEEKRLQMTGFKGPARGRVGSQIIEDDIEQSNKEAALLRHQKELEKERQMETLDYENRQGVCDANRGYFTKLALKSLRGEPRTWKDWIPGFGLGYNVQTEQQDPIDY